MYQLNDVVVYEGRGVFRVEEIGVPEFLNTKDQYYFLHPVKGGSGMIYVKVDNDQVAMRKVISRQSAEELLKELPQMDGVYPKEDKIRQKEYRDILKICECRQCMGMLKGIRKEQWERSAKGRRLGMSDEQCLKRVESLLVSELAVVFQTSTERMEDILDSAISRDQV